ncbi:MAG: hypothetical protein ACYCQJ_12700 [Nitrososphaerales archaeon]
MTSETITFKEWKIRNKIGRIKGDLTILRRIYETDEPSMLSKEEMLNQIGRLETELAQVEKELNELRQKSEQYP